MMVQRERAITVSDELSSVERRSSRLKRPLWRCAFVCLTGVSAWASCSSTDDPIGFNYPEHVNAAGAGGAPADPGPLGGAAGAPAGAAAGDGSIQRTYPNLFGELLGKTDDEITRKLDADFEQLFHGDPATEAIYVSVGADQAYVWDPRQMDIRSDGFANALLVSVELDRREEFDALWRFADAHLVLRTGPLRDYLRSRCDVSGDVCDETGQRSRILLRRPRCGWRTDAGVATES